MHQALFQEPKNFTHVTELTAPKASLIIISILQMGKLRLREVKSLAQEH